MVLKLLVESQFFSCLSIFFSQDLRFYYTSGPLFMLFYGLFAALYKCIYSALRETAPFCFILTWTLNLSLYLVCIKLNFGLRFPPPVFLDEEYGPGKPSKHSCEYILLPSLSHSFPCVGWPLTSVKILQGLKGIVNAH